MKRPALVVLFVVAASAGCGVRSTAPIGAGEAPTAEATALPESRLYFIRSGTLVPVARAVPPWDSQAVFDALVAGPTPAERARGLSSALTEFGRIEVVSDIAKNVTMDGGVSKAIVLRVQPNSSARGRGLFDFPSKIGLASLIGTGYEQIACTGRALATHPFLVEIVPYKSPGGAPAPEFIAARCPKTGTPDATPTPSAGP